MELQCPGKEKAVTSARDLNPTTFRRLVATRYRTRLDPTIMPINDEALRKQFEAEIKDLEKVDQAPDFLPARYLADGARCCLAVCRISTPSGKGTGFLIAPGVVMTNNHVLPNLQTAAGSVAEFNYENGSTPVAVQLLPSDLYLTDEELDFTIVACDKNSVKDIPHIPLSRNPSTITRNERASIIQHPAGRPKEVALHNSDVLRVMDKVIRYRTDTEPGSSGSPVFNDTWELVALHHAGWIEPDGRATNEGIRIPNIVAKLEQMGYTTASRHRVEEILATVEGTSSLLGFFDTAGLPSSDQEVVVDTFTGTRNFADIGFWNIEHFNNGISSSRVKAVANVFERLLMDAMGLVEVESGALDRLVSELANRGLSYDYKYLDVTGTQDLAILYDQETTIVRSKHELLDPFDTTDYLRATTPAGKTAFPRKPLLAEVEVSSDGTGDPAKFLMLVVHLKAFGDAESKARRKLAANVLSEIIVTLRDQEGLPVILGGDFNDIITGDALASLNNPPDIFSTTVDDQLGDDPYAITYVGDSHRSLIDHIVISGDIQPGPIMGDDTAIVRLDKSIADWSGKVSDHVPVVFRMVFRPSPIEINFGGKVGDNRVVPAPVKSKRPRKQYKRE